MSKISEATAAQLKRYHPDIPEERLPQIVARSLIGAMLSIIGLAFMGAAAIVTLRLLALEKTPSTLGFVALAIVGGLGVFFFGWGLLTAAGRLVKQPLQLAVATLRGMVDIYRGKNGRGDG